MARKSGRLDDYCYILLYCYILIGRIPRLHSSRPLLVGPVLQLPSPPTAEATSVICGMLFTNTVCGVRKEFADEQQPLMATVVL